MQGVCEDERLIEIDDERDPNIDVEGDQRVGQMSGRFHEMPFGLVI